MSESFSNTTIGNGVGLLRNINTLSTLFNFLWDLFFIIGISLGIIFIIVAGIKFATSSGNPQKFEEAKKTLIYAILGVLVVITFTSIFNLALAIIGSDKVQTYLDTDKTTQSIVLQEGDYDKAKSGAVITEIGSGFTVLIYILKHTAVSLALLFIIVAGIKYATSMGNPEKLAEAQATITWAIVGGMLALFFYFILIFFANIIGIQGLDEDIKLLPPDFFSF